MKLHEHEDICYCVRGRTHAIAPMSGPLEVKGAPVESV